MLPILCTYLALGRYLPYIQHTYIAATIRTRRTNNRINWHDDTKATALSSSTPNLANIGRMDMKLDPNWWAWEAWSIGRTNENKKQQPLNKSWRRGNLPRSNMKEATNNIACHAQPRNQKIHETDSTVAGQSSILQVPSIIQIIQAFFSSTSCTTCASNWNLEPQKQPPNTINNTHQYHLQETTLHPLESAASSSRIEWSHGKNTIITYCTSTAAIISQLRPPAKRLT